MNEEEIIRQYKFLKYTKSLPKDSPILKRLDKTRLPTVVYNLDETKVEELERYCDSNGMQIIESYNNLDLMLKELRRGVTIVCPKIKYLGHVASDILHIKDDIKKAGGNLILLDLNMPTNNIAFIMAAALVEYEYAIINIKDVNNL